MANLTGTPESDYLEGTTAPDTVLGLGGDDYLLGGGGADALYGGDGNDALDPDSHYDEELGAFVTDDGKGDLVDGGSGFDSVTLDFSRTTAAITADFRDSNRTVRFPDGTRVTHVELVGILGGSGDDRIWGGAFDDILGGGLGADILHGGGGSDLLLDHVYPDDLGPRDPIGDAFADTLYGEDGNDFLIGGLGDTLDGGDSDDTALVDFFHLTAPILVSLQGGTLTSPAGNMTFRSVEQFVYAGSRGSNDVTGGARGDTVYTYQGADRIDGRAGDDSIYSGEGNDLLLGGDGEDFLNGERGNDIIHGGKGNDFLISGSGQDWLYGEAGEDFLSVDFGSAVDGGSGNDTLSFSLGDATAGVSFTLAPATILLAGTDFIAIRNIERLQVYASEFGDTITGGALDDRFGGNGGDDIFAGLAGDDELSGDDGDDILDGGDDDDLLIGGDGDDILRGGRGNDTLFGDHAGVTQYVGDDLLLGGDGDDWLDGGLGTDIIDGGAGVDLARLDFSQSGSGVTFRLTAQQTVTTSLGVKTLRDIEAVDIAGSDFADTLTGGSGNDSFVGGAGGDRIDGGSGIDAISYAGSWTGVRVNLGSGVGQGGDAQGDRLINIENVAGSYADDILIGNDRANHLVGLGSSDALYGMGGDDLLDGGFGGGLIDGGTGVDTALINFQFSDTGLNFTLAPHVTILQDGVTTTLRSIEAVELIGTDADDHIVTGSGNDILYGGFGADWLDGGGGSDTAIYTETYVPLLIDLAAGTASSGGEGPADGDTLRNIENLVGGYEDDRLYGDGAANRLEGSSGNDSLHGRGGADALLGGDGDDILTGGTGADRLEGGIGIDTADYRDSATSVWVNLATGNAQKGNAAGDSFTSIENLSGSYHADILHGDGETNVIDGHSGNDELIGEGGDDVLIGGDGNDRIEGGGGSDLLIGGAGADRFLFRTAWDSPAGQADHIEDFQHGVDHIDLSAIDARPQSAADDAFLFIGASAFSGEAGQLRSSRIFVEGNDNDFTLIEGDLDGDRRADFSIILNDALLLSRSDFTL